LGKVFECRLGLKMVSTIIVLYHKNQSSKVFDPQRIQTWFEVMENHSEDYFTRLE
jgi:hypothetical protein